MNNKKMKHILNFQNFINENLTTDYSGRYESLRDFIINKNLEQVFKNKYDIADDEDFEDYVRGELGYDEEIIQELSGKDYPTYIKEAIFTPSDMTNMMIYLLLLKRKQTK